MTYVEPFVGAGAVFLHLMPQRAIINDWNSELINVYRTVKDNVEGLIEDLRTHSNTPEHFYAVRALDRNGGLRTLTEVQRASRIIFLNKTCYNGLYRVNSKGEFNCPFGRYRNPNIVNADLLRSASRYLNQREIRITDGDFEPVLDDLDHSHFVYLDPPYHPLSKGSSFTAYVKGGWGEREQTRLRDACDRLDAKGVRFLLSNSSAELVRELYSNYRIETVKASRHVNSDGAKRGAVEEVLVRNY